MAYSDLDEENDRRGLMGPGSAPTPAAAPSGGMAPAGAPAPGPTAAPRGGGGTGFVNLERILALNQGGGAQMADRVAQGVTTQAQKAEQGLTALQGQSHRSTAADLSAVNPTLYGQTEKDAGEASAAARGAGTAGGVGALLQDAYGKSGGYGSGMRGFDTFLARGAGGDTLGGLGAKYGGLSERLGLATKDYRPSAENAPKMGGGRPGGPITFGPPSDLAPAGGGTDVDEEERKRRMGG